MADYLDALKPVLLIFASLLLFFAKHFLFDFVFQTNYQIRTKGIYGHFGGMTHAALHAFGSLPAVIVFAPPWPALVVVLAVEFAIHYHADWLKEVWMRRTGWTPEHTEYWRAFGLDQFLHALTYLGLVAALYAITVRPSP